MSSRAALALALFLVGCSEPDGPLPPSVILISLDTVRADHLSLYGYERATTPRLEELAGESLVFERAYSVAPWTLPAHMSMLTGLYPLQHRVLGDTTALSLEIPLLAERLRAEGYATAGLYSLGWIDARFGFDRGFQYFMPHWEGTEAALNLAKVQKRLPEDAPWFLFVHLFDAHGKGVETPGSFLYDCPEGFATTFLSDAKKRLKRLSTKALWSGEHVPDASEVEAIVALYDGCIRYLDELVGRWIDEWRADGTLDRSILIVTADHGESLRDHEGKLNGHGRMWEEGLRVPLLVRLPGGERGGERLEAPVSLVDLVPTILDGLGLETEPGLAGHSLLGERPEPLRVVAQQPNWIVGLDGRYKLVRFRKPERERAYDLEEDPGERRPLRPGDHPELYEALHETLGPALGLSAPEFRERARPIAPGAADAETLEHLRDLGYLGD